MKATRMVGVALLGGLLVITLVCGGCATPEYSGAGSQAAFEGQATGFGTDTAYEAAAVAGQQISTDVKQPDATVTVRTPTLAERFQSTNVVRVETSGPTASETMEFKSRIALEPIEKKPNEASSGKIPLRGILVETVKTSNPLQVLNPFAGPNFSPDDNVTRDLITGKVSGLNILSIGF